MRKCGNVKSENKRIKKQKQIIINKKKKYLSLKSNMKVVQTFIFFVLLLFKIIIIIKCWNDKTLDEKPIWKPSRKDRSN